MLRSVALPTSLHVDLVAHLDRPDMQEDLCFALYRNSEGAGRTSSLLTELVFPLEHERHVHGNVAFTGDYFLRAAEAAADCDAGLALLHSHPTGTGWQDMSRDDIAAEYGHAARTMALTEKPLLGLTLGTGDHQWSARTWDREGRAYRRGDCATVRVVGDAMRVTRHPSHDMRDATGRRLKRTLSVWGPEAHSAMTQLRIGIVGLGSVGSMVAETLARTGFGHLTLIDFDSIEEHNLDRVLHATARDVRGARSKIEVLERALRHSATHPDIRVDCVDRSVTEPDGWKHAMDCDVIFSCVDRPWPRHALNLAAYAHLIPVIDGGILARADPRGRMIGADWKALTAAPGRRCLQCARQYDPAAVNMERNGQLDDPSYIDGLPDSHPLRARQNVFAFSLNTASLEVLQLINMVVAPQGIADVGVQNYHAVTGTMDLDAEGCLPGCPYGQELIAAGDTAPAPVGEHAAADMERAARRERRRTIPARWARLIGWALRVT